MMTKQYFHSYKLSIDLKQDINDCSISISTVLWCYAVASDLCQFFEQLVAMGWIDSLVIILDHFSLFESKLVDIKLESIIIRDLNMQGNLGDVL